MVFEKTYVKSQCSEVKLLFKNAVPDAEVHESDRYDLVLFMGVNGRANICSWTRKLQEEPVCTKFLVITLTRAWSSLSPLLRCVNLQGNTVLQ